MTKKQQQPATVDDDREAGYKISPDAQYIAYDTIGTRALIESGVIVVSGTSVTWREGHLEHVAQQYVADPVATRRNYAHDVEVAEMYSAEVWGKLIGQVE